MSYWRIISELPLLPVFFELNLSVEPNNNNKQKLMSPQDIRTNTNSLYYFLYFTLYFTNYNLLYGFFFFFTYFIKKVKQIHCKLWLMKYKVKHKNWYKKFVFHTVGSCVQIIQLDLEPWPRVWVVRGRPNGNWRFQLKKGVGYKWEGSPRRNRTS